jgi:hypothetical protein
MLDSPEDVLLMGRLLFCGVNANHPLAEPFREFDRCISRFEEAVDPDAVAQTVNPSPQAELRCPKCGDVHVYRVNRASVEFDSGEPPLIIDPAWCRACGAGPLEPTLVGSMVLACEYHKLLYLGGAYSEDIRELNSPLRLFEPTFARGEPIGFHRLRSYLQQELITQPECFECYLRLALTYLRLEDSVHSRPLLEKTLQLEPRTLEACLHLAAITKDEDPEAAFDLMHRFRKHVHDAVSIFPDVVTRRREKELFAKYYNMLAGKLGKAVEPLEVRQVTAKVGRNDPCPCGSGKKYKKCCMPKP